MPRISPADLAAVAECVRHTSQCLTVAYVQGGDWARPEFWQCFDRLRGFLPSRQAALSATVERAKCEYLAQVADVLDDLEATADVGRTGGIDVHFAADKARELLRWGELIESSKPPTRNSKSRSTRPKAPVNARMIARIQSDGTCKGWSLRQWARELKCAESTVQGTKTWRQLSETRELERVARQRDKRRRLKPRSQWEN